jgi:glutamate---cysteine ligase / carboxylate-amine ligase
VAVRIFDGVSNIRELSALVALTHCLIVDLDRRLDAGEHLPTMPPWHVQENKWRAARYGLDAVIIQDADSNERLVTEDIDELLNRLEPVAKSLSCSEELARVGEIHRLGASYQRQRRVAEENDGDLRAVVDALVGELDI